MDDANPIGRPSKYQSEFCQMLVKHMSEGYSFESFGALACVSKQTLYDWTKVHEEFLDAKERGLEAGRLFWERHGIEGLYSVTEYGDNGKPISSRSINSAIWSINMKNRFGWRERQPGEADVVINNITGLSDKDLDSRIEKLMSKDKEKK